MNRRLLASLALASALIASLWVAAPVGAARAPKAATVDLAFATTGGRCYAVMTASWSGYQVNHVRFIGYVDDPAGDVPVWVDTKTYPHGESHPSGSFTSTSTLAARPGEGWILFAIFRSNGGARLAEVWSPVAHAPAECLYP